MTTRLTCILPLLSTRSAGELNSDELERIVTIMQNPAQFKIPTWFLNRRKDITDGKNLHVVSNIVDQKLRDDIEKLKKIRAHRGLRHYWQLRVRGQHTCTTGRRSGRTGTSSSGHVSESSTFWTLTSCSLLPSPQSPPRRSKRANRNPPIKLVYPLFFLRCTRATFRRIFSWDRHVPHPLPVFGVRVSSRPLVF